MGKIKKSNDFKILKGNPSTYLIKENVNGQEKVFVGNREQSLERQKTEDFVNKKPRLDFTGLSKHINVKITSPDKSYHLLKDDFLEDENPLGLNPFPEEGVFVLADSLWKDTVDCK